jgi:hypothetical protein
VTTKRVPKRRSDGSFSIEVGLSISAEIIDKIEFVRSVQEWFDTFWTDNPKLWTGRSLTGPEHERYADEFSAPPRVTHFEGSKLTFRLEGKATPKPTNVYKDWLVLRIGRELNKRFPEVGEVRLISLRNSDET